MRFIISEIGIFNLSIKEEEVKLLKESFINPDITLSTDAMTFIYGLLDRRYLMGSVLENKSHLTGDFSPFYSMVRVEELVEVIRKSISENNIGRKIIFSEEKDVAKKAAELLAEGKVIAWFQDNSEFGPRALGHRSILADPRKDGVQKFINNKIKFREDFRPFAPSILREKVGEYFEYSGDSPYMLIVAPVKEKWRKIIPGVVHVDNSARIQTVTLENNEKYYTLIKEFELLTGLPILLNTSFNKKGMPIIETPLQALIYFYECALDCLVMGDFIIRKTDD